MPPLCFEENPSVGRYGSMIEVETKHCSKCKKILLLDDFHKACKNDKYRTHASRCKKCVLSSVGAWRRTEAGFLRRREWGRENYRNNLSVRLKHRENRWKRSYGISSDQFHKMLLAQCGRCEICGSDFQDLREPHVDHCHLTGKVRGLLCFTCNSLLGFAKDQVSILKKAVVYLG